jgi:DNA invertase Pin-like site-specific DNA recombinase
MASPVTRAAVYVRVSRSDQREALQEDECRELVARRRWELVEVYADHGVSGRRDRRPALDRLMADARRRRFDVLVVWRSDRLFRSVRAMVNALGELDALGVSFVSATEVFDTTTPQGRLLLHLVAAFGEFERQVLVERTVAGLAAAKRRGVRLGRPPGDRPPAGRVRALREAGKSWATIARELGCTSSAARRAVAR